MGGSQVRFRVMVLAVLVWCGVVVLVGVVGVGVGWLRGWLLYMVGTILTWWLGILWLVTRLWRWRVVIGGCVSIWREMRMVIVVRGLAGGILWLVCTDF
jgi:hypothetical protein